MNDFERKLAAANEISSPFIEMRHKAMRELVFPDGQMNGPVERFQTLQWIGDSWDKAWVEHMECDRAIAAVLRWSNADAVLSALSTHLVTLRASMEADHKAYAAEVAKLQGEAS
jgi:hypothetical protein